MAQRYSVCRAEDRRGHSHLCAARSANGVDDWQIDPQPTLMPDPEHFPEEAWGIEDPRITYVPELECYAVVYTAYTRDGPGVALALTEDFRQFERYGLIMPPDDKDAALLPHRIGDHGLDPSPGQRSQRAYGRAYLDFLLRGSAALGQSEANTESPARRLVGRQ
jgi:predicted GH43/DUF377 family glycosyl hydrolase